MVTTLLALLLKDTAHLVTYANWYPPMFMSDHSICVPDIHSFFCATILLVLDPCIWAVWCQLSYSHDQLFDDVIDPI